MEFVPISLDLINEGELLNEYNDKIQQAVQTLLEYRKKYGDLNTTGKEIAINLKLKIKMENPEECQYSIKGEIEIKNPNPPARMSLAMEEEHNGKANLLVANSGSHESDPKQMKLFKNTGENIPAES